MKKLMIPLLFLLACSNDDDTSPSQINHREEMRSFVIGISTYAKAIQSGFAIIPQNGIELVTDNGESTGSPSADYLSAIDGNGQEDLFYGYDNDNKPTPTEENEYLTELLDVSKNAGNTILVTDYCSTPSYMDDSYDKNNSSGYISFAADQRELNSIPSFPNPVYNENDQVITSLAEAKNFLYLINPESFASKIAFIEAVTATNYDLLIIDLFFSDGSAFTVAEIEELKNKANGGKRLVICYMSIGEAEDYRYYWQAGWNSNKPSWLDAENPDWEGNYKVKYWESEWQNIIYGNDDSYLKRILDAGYDGVYLDIIDAFEYFE